MKVCVLSYPGSMGKTLVASQVLARHMPQARFFAIESVNETAEAYGKDVEKMLGEKFQKLYKEIMLLDDAVVDVGASNVVPFLEGLVKYNNAQKEFSAFIIPSTSGSKEQKETITMIETLRGLGIEASRIKVVCNRVESDVEEEFSTLFSYASKNATCELSPDAAIWENELMDLLQVRRMSLADILEDHQDHRAIARQLGDNADPKVLAMHQDIHIMQDLAVSVCDNFNRSFRALFPEWS